jgi:hypothetical protein
MNRNEKLKALAKKAYECANISNDGYTTYPIGDDGVVQVSTIENGKTFNFISPANARKRMERQMTNNLQELKCNIIEHSCPGVGGYFLRPIEGMDIYAEGYSTLSSKDAWYKYNGKYLTKDFHHTENLEEARYIIVIDEDNI